METGPTNPDSTQDQDPDHGHLQAEDREDFPIEVMRRNLAEHDQSQADLDQTHSDRDQTASERDQLASDADQAAADRDLRHHHSQKDSDYPDYHLSRVQRLSGTAIRHATRGERFASAASRDLTSKRRDENAAIRDRMAHRQDLEDIKSQANAAADTDAAREALRQLTELRTEAAADREEAAADRQRAAGKRQLATKRRMEAIEKFRMANQSQITGVLYRGAGDLALEGEFQKARDGGSELLMVGLCLDGHEDPADPGAEGGGDGSVLRKVADEIRSRVPDGTPIVSHGQNSLLFTLPGATTEDVLKALLEIDPMIVHDHPNLRIAIGKTPMGGGDTFPVLLERTLTEMREARVALYEPSDGASADGASADGASADGASADGASADGASADGA